MKRIFVAAVLALSLLPASASAVDLKNIRICYGPLGATRKDNNVLPGDYLFMTYDIEELAVDPKTGKVRYETVLELLDGDTRVLFKSPKSNEAAPQLGSASMPGDLHVIMAPTQAPGRYRIRLTVKDKVAKEAIGFEYQFNVIAPTFGMVGIIAPAVGFSNQRTVVHFSLANLGIDPATLSPYVDVTIRILDDFGKPVAAPAEIRLPRDMPEGVNLAKDNLVPLSQPVFLKQSGRFTIEIIASDKVAKMKAELRYPFTVIDMKEFTEPPKEETRKTPAAKAPPPVPAVVCMPPVHESTCETRPCAKRFNIFRSFRCR